MEAKLIRDISFYKENKAQLNQKVYHSTSCVYNILNNNNEPTSNTLRSFSVTYGFDKDATIIDTTPNRYESTRSTNSQNNQQPNVKLLTIPSKSRPSSAGHNSSSSSNIGLSIFKESSTIVQTIESKSTKTGATISMNNNN